MRVFIYEHLMGGGLLAADGKGSTLESLAREGMAMLAAVLSDFGRIEGCEVETLLDARWSESVATRLREASTVRVHFVTTAAEADREFDRLAAASDWSLIVAPELDGALLARCERVVRAGGRLLGPGLDLIALASDKQATAVHLARFGVPVPPGVAIAAGKPPPLDFSYPAVLKPRDGAGSQFTVLIESRPTPPEAISLSPSRPSRLERFCPGLPASVAALCGPGGIRTLPPCNQRIAADGRMTYLGGWLPLPTDLARRATALAERALATLPSALGYLGVDLILGESPDGRDDYCLEINPRLTTSYVGLRKASQSNLAAAILAIAEGRDVRLAFDEREIEF